MKSTKAALLANVCVAILIGPAAAQGLFDVVTSSIVDTVNSSMGVSPPAEVRQLQVDAARVALRGTPEDWERFVGSAVEAAGASYEPAFERTRAVARDSDASRDAILGRTFVNPGGSRHMITTYSLGRFDPSGRMLAFVTSVDANDPDALRSTFRLLSVVDPGDDFKLKHLVPFVSTGIPAHFERNLPPGTALDLDGDGIDEIFLTTGSWSPRSGTVETAFQWINVLTWRTDANEHLLPADRSGVVMDQDAGYVVVSMPEAGISTTRASTMKQTYLETYVERGTHRDQLFVRLWEWPASPFTGYVAFADDLGAPIQRPWELARPVWLKEAFLDTGEPELRLELVERYQPELLGYPQMRFAGHEYPQWVELVGAGFQHGATLRVNFDLDDVGQRPTVVVVDDTRLRAQLTLPTATVPEDVIELGGYVGPGGWVVRVENPDGTHTAWMRLRVLPPDQVNNGSMWSALVLAGSEGRTHVSSMGATKDAHEPDHAANPGGASIWFEWQAPTSGHTTFNTSGSDFNTLLAIYDPGERDHTGSFGGYEALSPVATSAGGGVDTHGAVTFTAVEGKTYLIAVDGYDGASGSAYLNWQQSQADLRGSPNIASHQPAPIVAYERRQWIEFTGSNFAEGATVTLTTGSAEFVIPPERTEVIDGTAVRIFAGVFPADREAWYAVVSNPDGRRSTPHLLDVRPPTP